MTTDDVGVDERAGRGNRHQPRQHAVARHRDVRLAEHQYQKTSAAAEPAHAARFVFTATTQMRRSVARERRARIETHPAKQQDERARHDKHDVVGREGTRLAVRSIFAKPRAQG